MEKLKEYINKEYPPVKIYIDDLERIDAVLKDNSINYSIKTDKYRYNNLSEFINSSTDRKTKNLIIETSKPYMIIEFQKMSAKVYISLDGMIETAVFYRIDEILRQSRRFFPFIYSYYFILIVNALLSIESTLLNPNGKLFPEYVDFTLLAIGYLWIARMTYIRLVKHSSIQLIRKEHVSNFFQRKRDDLILMILSAFAGAILGAILTILTTRFLH